MRADAGAGPEPRVAGGTCRGQSGTGKGREAGAERGGEDRGIGLVLDWTLCTEYVQAQEGRISEWIGIG